MLSPKLTKRRTIIKREPWSIGGKPKLRGKCVDLVPEAKRIFLEFRKIYTHIKMEVSVRHGYKFLVFFVESAFVAGSIA